MSKTIGDYGRAHAAVLEAQEQHRLARVDHRPSIDEETGDPVESPEVAEAAKALAAAHVALRAAEEPLAGQVTVAWDANQQAVADAKEALAGSINDLAAAETRAGDAARRRDPSHPVLNADEKAACRAALERVEAAREEHRRAVGRFKRGVTAEQIEAVT